MYGLIKYNIIISTPYSLCIYDKNSSCRVALSHPISKYNLVSKDGKQVVLNHQGYADVILG